MHEIWGMHYQSDISPTKEESMDMNIHTHIRGDVGKHVRYFGREVNDLVMSTIAILARRVSPTLSGKRISIRRRVK